MKKSEEKVPKDFTPEAVTYLQREVPKLTEGQYEILSIMVATTPSPIDLKTSEEMIQRIKGFDILEFMMYTGEEFSLHDQFTPEALAHLKEEVQKMTGKEIDTLGSDLRQRAYWKREEEITEEDAKCFVYMAKHPEEVEAIAFGNLVGNWRY